MDEQGRVSGLTVSLIACVLLLLTALIFGFWAYAERQDYKNNSDEKVAAAVKEAVAATREEEGEKYAQEAKKPLKPYVGPSQFGSVQLRYPKTWSAYIINKDTGSTPIDWYLHPNVVPDISSSSGNAYALRVEVVDQSYDRSLSSFDNDAENGAVTVQPYALPKVKGTIGSRINGEIDNDVQGSMVILPLRNMTLKIWTESKNYLEDFNDIILPNATFSP